MAPAEPLPKTTLSAATMENFDWHDLSKNAKGVNPFRLRPNGASAESKAQVQLAPPLTKKAHRILTKKTEALMRERDDLDRVLLSQASRLLKDLSVSDWLLRDNILKRCERLDRKEKRHIQIRTEALDELTRRYKSDPSTEREVDRDLVKELLCKFQRHLGHKVVAADKAKGGDDQGAVDASSSGPSPSGDRAAAEVASSTPGKKDEGQKSSTTDGLDGAFDDVRLAKKRKQDDLLDSGKESQKKAKKEQTTSDTQSPLKTDPGGPLASQKTKAREERLAAIKAEMGAVPQKKTPKQDESVDRKAKEATTVKSQRDNGIQEPFYKLHARAMMEPDFNDHVHERPANRRKKNFNKVTKEYNVAGAIGAMEVFLSQKRQPQGGQKRQVQSGKGRSRNGRY